MALAFNDVEVENAEHCGFGIEDGGSNCVIMGFVAGRSGIRNARASAVRIDVCCIVEDVLCRSNDLRQRASSSEVQDAEREISWDFYRYALP